MPNTIPAAGEAMPNPTRRAFLGGLAVASALAGAGVAHATAKKHEDAELLTLTATLDEAHGAFLAAEESLPRFQAAFQAIAPSGEGVLFEEHYSGLWRHQVDFYRDPTSPKYADLKSANGRRMMVVSVYAIDRQVKAGTLNPSFTHEIRAKAAQFEHDVEAAVQSSGLEAALEAYWRAEVQLRRVVQDIVKIRANTLEGIALKVRATAAYAALGTDERHIASMWIAKAIWSDLGEEA
ncbi:twin-arginine translocation signal domain-containing protein [Rhizobium pusense]|uniref:twin-arginine translocation signal domain-containing protein n=1 Tax=Agrobacterium pusense TaxID=648995 RepID=UPI00129BF291|nr:twin-arginine translocation signal domain-containing protein [Agrobacterium pusense]MRG66123.1 twin-arginine translocation signal domain-containing protein [Agrobacterium pusense]